MEPLQKLKDLRISQGLARTWGPSDPCHTTRRTYASGIGKFMGVEGPTFGESPSLSGTIRLLFTHRPIDE